MNTEQKATMMNNIISVLRFRAANEKKAFDGGDMFFSLAFKTDAELRKIARLCGV